MAKVKDPVCGAEIDADGVNRKVASTSSGAGQTDPTAGTKQFHDGVWYYFDSLDCRVRFMADPESYIGDS